MNEAPKELSGRELLKHAADLDRACEQGEKIELWVDVWSPIESPTFNQPLWRYRVAPTTVVRYVNVYPNCQYASGGFTWRTREEADAGDGDTRIACVRIEFREGQYDE